MEDSRSILRSTGALFAGFVVVVVLAVGTDFVMHAFRVFPRLGQPMAGELFVLATVYRTIYAVFGSYITARLAPNRPMQHALAGGGVGLLLSIAGAAATWNRGAEFGPHWYPLALVITALPCAWAGGKIRMLQLRARVEA